MTAPTTQQLQELRELLEREKILDGSFATRIAFHEEVGRKFMVALPLLLDEIDRLRKIEDAARNYAVKFITTPNQEADPCSACGARSSLSGIMPLHAEDCVLGEVLQDALQEGQQ